MIKRYQKNFQESYKSPLSVAVIITHEAFVVNKILLANQLVRSADDSSILVVSFVKSERLYEILYSRKIELICSVIFLDSEKTKFVSFLENIKTKISSLPYLKIYLIPAVFAEVLYSKRIMKIFRKTLIENVTHAIILSETCPDYLSPEIVKASQGISTVFTHPYERMEPDDYALIYKNSYLQITDPLRRLIAKYFPKWKHLFQSVDILRASPEKILAQELLNISSEKPWETFGYLEDYILSSNTLIKNHLIDVCQVPEEKILLTGSAQLDILHQLMSNHGKKQEMIGRLRSLFGNEKPFLLSSLPQTHWVTGRNQAEFDNHKDMLEAWMSPLTQQKRFNVLLSLHPSMERGDFTHLEQENAKIIDENIIDLMPLCELFVNCLSTVMQFAAACGIPVINYDVYRYSEDLEKYKYNEFGGILTVTSKEEYQKMINEICTDNTFLFEMRKEQERVAGHWGPTDGKSAERIVSAIKKSMTNE